MLTLEDVLDRGVVAMYHGGLHAVVTVDGEGFSVWVGRSSTGFSLRGGKASRFALTVPAGDLVALAGDLLAEMVNDGRIT